MIRAEGPAGGAALQPYATIPPPPPTAANPHPQPKHVYPDRYISGVPGKSSRLVVDHTVVTPQASRYLPAAATTAGHAAAAAHAAKIKHYTQPNNLLHQGDELCIPAFETFGAVAKPFHDLLRHVAVAHVTDELQIEHPGRSLKSLEKLIERRTAELMRCWQVSLSSALLHGRLDMLARARGKVFKTMVKQRSLPQHAWASSSHSRAVFLGHQGAFRSS